MNRIRFNREQNPSIIAPELHSQFIEYLGGCIKGGIWVGWIQTFRMSRGSGRM